MYGIRPLSVRRPTSSEGEDHRCVSGEMLKKNSEVLPQDGCIRACQRTGVDEGVGFARD
jgi:hypothetical protein